MTDGDEELKEQIKELSEKMERLEEAFAAIANPYRELRGYMDQFQSISSGYFKLLGLYQKHGAVSPEMIVPDLKDPISKDIVKVLFEKPDKNISRITELLKRERGKASRRIVREKLQDLVERGVVEETAEGKAKTYRVTDVIAEKWLELLGVKRPEK